jgi:TRAP-type C4-dicarboxylate transport system substrate-binding protein
MKRKKPVFMRQCDWCGTDLKTNEPDSDSYVCTMDHKIFCRIQTPGQPAFKDCLADYAEDRRKNVQEKKQKKQERLQPQKKVSVQEKEEVVKKFDDLLNHFKQRSRRLRHEA